MKKPKGKIAPISYFSSPSDVVHGGLRYCSNLSYRREGFYKPNAQGLGGNQFMKTSRFQSASMSVTRCYLFRPIHPRPLRASNDTVT